MIARGALMHTLGNFLILLGHAVNLINISAYFQAIFFNNLSSWVFFLNGRIELKITVTRLNYATVIYIFKKAQIPYIKNMCRIVMTDDAGTVWRSQKLDILIQIEMNSHF